MLKPFKSIVGRDLYLDRISNVLLHNLGLINSQFAEDSRHFSSRDDLEMLGREHCAMFQVLSFRRSRLSGIPKN